MAVGAEDLANLLGDDVDQQQALLDNILLLSTSEGGLSRVIGGGEAGWEILVEFAFGRRFGWSEGGGESMPNHPLWRRFDDPLCLRRSWASDCGKNGFSVWVGFM